MFQFYHQAGQVIAEDRTVKVVFDVTDFGLKLADESAHMIRWTHMPGIAIKAAQFLRANPLKPEDGSPISGPDTNQWRD